MNNSGIFSKVLSWFSLREQEQLKKDEECRLLLEGQQLWQEVNKTLPKAHGVISNDKLRINEFQKLVKNFSPQQKLALINWLKHEIKEFSYNFCELSTGREEEYERQQLQIFHEHLKVLQP